MVTHDWGKDLGAAFSSLAAGERICAYNAPVGLTAFVLSELSAHARCPVLFVASDERAMREAHDCLGFFAPSQERLLFPAWDCLPYDRVSPAQERIGERVAFLSRLADSEAGLGLMTTSVAAILQRVAPRASWDEQPPLVLRTGAETVRTDLQDFFLRSGYKREEVVRTPGSYVFRGGILDVFPPYGHEAVRVDFFGDRIESLRYLDVVSQRSAAHLESLTLLSSSEVALRAEAWQRFCANYRRRFGTKLCAYDPLFRAAEDGQSVRGFEHFLPLFFEKLETLADFLPQGCIVVLGQDSERACALRWETIGDHYTARRLQNEERRKGREGDTLVRPVLESDDLYLDEKAWQSLLAPFAVVSLQAGATMGKSAEHSVDCGGAPCPSFLPALKQEKLYELLRARVKRKRHIFTAFGEESLRRIALRMRENGIPIEAADSYACLSLRPVEVPAAARFALRQGCETDQFALVTETELFGERFLSRTRRRTRTLGALLVEANALVAGERVVHSEHGVGQFEGLESVVVGGAPHACVKILYAGHERLYVPVESLDCVSRLGEEGGLEGGALDKLGGLSFSERKARAKKRLRDIADRLIATQAERDLYSAPRFSSPSGGGWQDFCLRFPHVETEDQSAAIHDVLEDLRSGQPMDRMICGDAGFGKTEVALRAAFVAAASGAQVLLLAPTTLLVEQHARVFRARFEGLPYSIGVLSRMQSQAERTRVRASAQRGEIHILIGTHAALSKQVVLPHLGLVVIDEEQSFGVRQKERWKRKDIHILTLSATPIPRSFHMALSGLRKISVIMSAPYDRLQVRSFVSVQDSVSIAEALRRERLRGGQTFCVVPRIADLDRVSRLLQALSPESYCVVAHGRLAPSLIESRMQAFLRSEVDILLSTNIVEAGLDIPRANTMLVFDAHKFGLGQLYQLRGRVGRAQWRGYCYFFFPEYASQQPLAMRRLSLLETLDGVGAGFRVSMQDLDMRGAGNLLGEEQSGRIRDIGVELYRKLLREAIAERRGQRPPLLARITLGIPVAIPEDYVAEERLRMALYRRLAALEGEAARQDFAEELRDRFGTLPHSLESLFALFTIKEYAEQARIETLEVGEAGVSLRFHENRFAAPEKLIAFMQKNNMRVQRNHLLFLPCALGTDGEKRKRIVLKLVQALAKMASGKMTAEMRE